MYIQRKNIIEIARKNRKKIKNKEVEDLGLDLKVAEILLAKLWILSGIGVIVP